MPRKTEHPRTCNSVRICISRTKDKDILQAVKSGYSLPLLASYACYAHAGLFPPIALKGVDLKDDDVFRERVAIHFTPETVSKPVYEELKDLESREISAKIKEYIRENIRVELPKGWARVKRPIATGDIYNPGK